jgi:hypothetical protein
MKPEGGFFFFFFIIACLEVRTYPKNPCFSYKKLHQSYTQNKRKKTNRNLTISGLNLD